MNILSIVQLIIRNFKGIQSLDLDMSGNDTAIHGDNATGKTTVVDAFYWLMFGKDSQGKADFQIKPVDSTGNIETSVKALIKINDDTMTLEKRFYGKLIKKRGSALPELVGYTTDCFIDDVPVKKSEYEEGIKGIARGDGLFELLSNPGQFNQIHWHERRNLLLKICGDFSTEEIIKSDKELEALPGVLGKATIDDHRKKVKFQIKDITKELSEIPVRISELSGTIKQVSADYYQSVEQQKQALKDELYKLQRDKESVYANTASFEMQMAIRTIENTVLDLRDEGQQSMHDAKRDLRDQLTDMNNELNAARYNVKKLELSLKKSESEVMIAKTEIEAARQRWHQQNSKQFTTDATCPTCGQDMPEEQIEEANSRFNLHKAESLKRIQQEGKTLAEKCKNLMAAMETTRQETETLGTTTLGLSKKIKDIETRMEAITMPAALSSRIADLEKEQAELYTQMEQINAGAIDTKGQFQTRIYAIEKHLAQVATEEAEARAGDAARKRMEELENREKVLARELEKLEHQLYMCDRFTNARGALLEEKVNTKFRLAKFKLFEEQINGGIAECCETLYLGVSYNKGLNNAARINIGIDIINTLSEHYGLTVPIFIDNAESVTDLMETNGQLIRLVVDATAEKLQQITTETNRKAA